MSIFTALTRRWNYSVERPGAGRLIYREGNQEFTFPVYEEDGCLVLVGWPSSRRIYFFFNSHQQSEEFTAAERARIIPRVETHLRASGISVKLFQRDEQEEGAFELHSELFGHRSRATELLEAAGFTWLCDFSSIDALHEEYGLEICGIRDEACAEAIAGVLRQGFPQWHHQTLGRTEGGREPGWTIAICMFPALAFHSSWPDAE